MSEGPTGDASEKIESDSTILNQEEKLRKESFNFLGNGKEYFNIWIVNLFLSLVTLGVYSAWAKVRSKKYFLRNTRFAGHSFDYHANPKSILKGRVFILIIMAIIYGFQFLAPKLGGSTSGIGL